MTARLSIHFCVLLAGVALFASSCSAPGSNAPAVGEGPEAGAPVPGGVRSGRLKEGVESAFAEKQPAKRLQKLADLGAELTLAEISDAFIVARSFSQVRERVVLQEAALRRLSDLAPVEAFAHAAKLPESRLKVEAIRFTAMNFARRDVERAAAAATEMAAGRSRNEAIEAVAEVWAEIDVQRALLWAEGLPGGFARESALNAVRFSWAHSDPVSAAEAVGRLAAGDTKNSLIKNVAGRWAAFDPPGAVRWAKVLPEGPERELALVNVAESWADQDPASAAVFALELSPAELRQRAAVAVISRWATQDPQRAMAWATQADDPEIQKRGTEEVLGLWVAIDPAESGRWVDGLKASPQRDHAIQAYAAAVIVWAPEFAARRAISIADEAARHRSIEEIVPRWLELDPVSAKNWLREADLPAAMKARWLAGASER